MVIQMMDDIWDKMRKMPRETDRIFSGFLGQSYKQTALPAKVLPDKAVVEYKDGVLTVTTPKAKEKKAGKRLDIR
jgi:HSP20 family molecular chaperone IbpA